MDQRLHVGRTMRRRLKFLLGLAGGCWLLLPALGLAQTAGSGATTNTGTSSTGGIAVQLRLVGDESYTAKGFRRTPIGKDQCDQKVNLTFRVSNLAIGPASPKYIEIYRGTACNTTEGKDGVGDDDCQRIKYVNRNSSSIQDIELPLADLCDSEGDVTLWFLPVNTLDTNANVSPYGVFQLPLDVIPPNAPTNVKGGDGETQIQITWQRADTNISRNWIIWDPKPITSPTVTDSGAGVSGAEDDGGTSSGSSDGSCGSALMSQGMMIDVDKLPKGLSKKELRGDVESGELSGDLINSPRAAVGIVAQDLAGNFSVLSNITCVNVVDTSGFWDDYKINGGEAEGGCACSLPGSTGSTAPHGRNSLGGLLTLLAVLGLGIVRARRKRHSS